MGRKKKYLTEEERIAAKRERVRKWREANPDYDKQRYQENLEKERERKRKRYQENPEKVKESNRKWRENNPDYWKKYQSTPIGRANILASAYRQKDKMHNRGECTITPQWIVDNVFNGQRCFYCDESDWTELGCDRIYNNLPHTPDNVVPCCEECNVKRGRKDFVDFLKEIGRLDKLKELKGKVIITDNVFVD